MTDSIGCVEAEAALLGCMMRGGWFLALSWCEQVEEADLAEPVHRLVRAGIAACAQQKIDPDPVTILGELRRNGTEGSFSANRAAGNVLADLYGAGPVADSAGHYAGIVLEHSARRRISEAGVRLTQAAGSSPMESLRAMAGEEWTEVFRLLSRVEQRRKAEQRRVEEMTA